MIWGYHYFWKHPDGETPKPIYKKWWPRTSRVFFSHEALNDQATKVVEKRRKKPIVFPNTNPQVLVLETSHNMSTRRWLEKT